MRRPQATHRWSWRGSRWPEEGCPREAEPAAGGVRRRWSSGVQGRKGRAGEDAVEDGEADGATSLGRERAEWRVPLWTELGGANGGGGGSRAHASRSGQLL
jgi:hypothetical protein